MTAPKFPLVRVRWLDSNGPRGWSTFRNAVEVVDLSIETVGWLIQSLDDRITVAAHVQMSDIDAPHVDGVMTIPRISITRMETIADWQADA